MLELIYQHYCYYVREAARFWQNLGPYEYGGLLLFIGFVGWLLMRGRSR